MLNQKARIKKRGAIKTLSRRDFVWGLLFWAVITAGVGYRSWLLWPYFRACYLVPSWAETEGTVRSATIARSYYGGKQRRWQVNPVYSYEVDGRHFEGTLFQVAPQLTQDRANSTAAQLLAARSVPVYYDKSNPAFSTLIVPVAEDVGMEVGLISIVCFIAGGIYMFSRLIAPRPSN